ncbi:hypothetical protein [Arthrobacter sp. G119Y2]|uniref:hypothetical protein n=1 Tax=Arthrobacter sp. G119Y2 TaxID=3134965 RepID=UPI00311992E8
MSLPSPPEAAEEDTASLRQAPPSALRRLAGGVYGQAAATALLLGVLTNSGNRGLHSGLPGGYSAGTGDHYVLSALGLHWADPSRYAGDWFLEAAPQPHWFFDSLTYLGSSLGILGTVYVLFWCSGLAAFGLAVSFLSRKWAPNTPWLFGAATTVLASLSPWMVVGTGSSMLALAIPAVVSANLTLLFIAAALTGREKWMLAAAVLAAVVHVQQGAVVSVLLAALILVQALHRRTLPKAAAAGLLLTAAIVLGGLAARPVAANTADFVDICNELIAYHCAAQLWGSSAVIFSVAIIGLALLTFLYEPFGGRTVWAAVVGLPMVGLFLGLMANVLSVPFFGELAQGLNVYRLGALVMPFAVMALLLPVFRLRTRNLPAVLLILVLTWEYLLDGSWQPVIPFSALFAGAYLLLVLIPVVLRSRRPEITVQATRWCATALIVLFLGTAAGSGGLTLRGLQTGYIPDSDIREWGEAVEEVVPAGESLLAPPLAAYVRAATYRGVIADCKNIPYGGEPWVQWQERLGEMGGVDQCRQGDPRAYNSLSSEELDRISERYGVSYMVLEGGQAERLPELQRLGWSAVLNPVNAIQNVVLRKTG